MDETVDPRGEGRTAVRGTRRAAGDIATTVIASIAIALPLVFYLHQHVEILRLGYEIESLEDRRVELAERSRELRVERLRSANLARVEEQAVLLGLSAPAPTDVYVAASAAVPQGSAPSPADSSAQPRLTARLQ